MEGRHACWFDDGRLQPIDDTVLSEEDGASTTARGRSGTIAPPSYNDVIRADHEGRAPAGSFRGAWTHAGHTSPMAGAGHYQPPVGAYSHHTIVEPVAGFFLPLPEGWEHVIGGNIPHPFFVDHINRRTQTLDPRPVPMGWEQMVTSDGWAYFVDHVAKRSYWTHPCSYPLPGPNWQIMYDDNDELYFIDHDARKTYTELPSTAAGPGGPPSAYTVQAMPHATAMFEMAGSDPYLRAPPVTQQPRHSPHVHQPGGPPPPTGGIYYDYDEHGVEKGGRKYVADALGVVYRGEYELDNEAGLRYFELFRNRIQCYRSRNDTRPEHIWPLAESYIELEEDKEDRLAYSLVVTPFVRGQPTPKHRIRGLHTDMNAWAVAIGDLQEEHAVGAGAAPTVQKDVGGAPRYPSPSAPPYPAPTAHAALINTAGVEYTDHAGSAGYKPTMRKDRAPSSASSIAALAPLPPPPRPSSEVVVMEATSI